MPYENMNWYFKSIFETRMIKRMNVFINLDDVFHSLHRPHINDVFQTSGNDAGKELISNVLNLLGHYKWWVTKKNIECRIFGIFTSAYGNFKNDIYIPYYRKKFIDLNDRVNMKYFYINLALSDAYPLMKVISQYIQNVYIIDSNYIEPSVIPYYLTTKTKFSNSDWNMLISRDYYDFQYAYKGNWTLVCPKYNEKCFLNKDNIWEYIKEKEKVQYEIEKFNADLFLYALAITGDKYRNIPRTKNIAWKTMFKILLDVHSIGNNLPESTMELLIFEKVRTKFRSVDEFNKIIMASNILDQSENIGEIDSMSISNQMNDITDYDTLQEFNKLYFSKYPINMNFLSHEINFRKKDKLWF